MGDGAKSNGLILSERDMAIAELLGFDPSDLIYQDGEKAIGYWDVELDIEPVFRFIITANPAYDHRSVRYQFFLAKMGPHDGEITSGHTLHMLIANTIEEWAKNLIGATKASQESDFYKNRLRQMGYLSGVLEATAHLDDSHDPPESDTS